MHYLLFYEYASDYMERREKFRTEHLTLAWQSHARGELILDRVVADPTDGVLLFQGDSPKIIEAFVAADPYVNHELVTRWRVRPWNTVVGANASNPVRDGKHFIAADALTRADQPSSRSNTSPRLVSIPSPLQRR